MEQRNGAAAPGEDDASTVASTAGPGAPPNLRVPALTVLAHPDARRVGERVLLSVLGSGRPVEVSRRSPLFAPPGEGRTRPLADPHLSRRPVVLAPGGRGGGSVRVEVPGDVRCEGLPASGELSADDLARGVAFVLADRVALLLHLAPAVSPRDADRHGLVGESGAVVRLRTAIRRTASSSAPVLLRGETGTGKEMVARAIHDASPRRGRPYLALNLGAVPSSLAASELFGAARGAFTGADRRREGYFERADSGTLFLDEIGEAPLEVQAHLLRALEDGEIQPVGGERMRRVDVRVVAATDADLEAAVAAGRFRAALFHRLQGDVIPLPPLRERRDDVGRLLVHFLRAELGGLGLDGLLEDPGPRARPWLSARLVARLAAAEWPGNVRELRNVARRLAAGAREGSEAVQPDDLLERPRPEPRPDSGTAASERTPPRARGSYRSVAEVGDEELLVALRATSFNLAAAAAELGVSRTALYTLVDRHPAIRKAASLTRDELEAAVARAGGDLDRAAADLEVSPHGLRLRRTQLALG